MGAIGKFSWLLVGVTVLAGACSSQDVDKKVNTVSTEVKKDLKTVDLKVHNMKLAVGKELKTVNVSMHKAIRTARTDVDRWIPDPDKDLRVVDYKMQANGGNKKIVTGSLKNKSNRHYTQVAVSFNLYDAKGALVGNTKATIANLDPHGTWKFDAPIATNREQIAQVKLKEISGS